MKTYSELYAAISAVCPIISVTVPNMADKSGWIVQYDPSATSAQRSAAQSTINSFDVNAASVPQSVSPRQARLALNAAGLLPQVEAMVAAADKKTQITWEFATEIARTDPILLSLAAALSLNSAQIDALFIQAASL